MGQFKLKNMSQFNVCSVLLVIFSYTNAFNLSPKPNLVLQEPKLSTYMPKAQTSYFGFTINLRTNSVIIGAPRAQSSLPLQRTVNETGAIYKCTLDLQPKCDPYLFDERGNTNDELNEYIFNNEKKEFQWLGAAMDGNSQESDRLVVCAPRMVADVGNQYLMHGVCYWTPNTTGPTPKYKHKIAPLRLRGKQYTAVDGQQQYYHMYGEQGISVHLTENNEEILIGAPGIFTWKGSVIRYRAKVQDDFGGLNRREESGRSQHIIEKRSVVEYVSDIPNPLLWNQADDSYFGYAVTSGYFDGPGSTKLLYVASAPQANFQQGEVYIFDIIDTVTTDKSIKIYHTISSHQMGEYFGYALVAEDFDQDGYTDLAVAAPFHSRGGASFENGAVYIYRNLDGNAFGLQATLQSNFELNGRFGTTISKIGDLNNDGFNDLIVGAPYEEHGAVYVFLGSANGIVPKPSQRILAPPNNLAEPFSPHMFGHGLSKGADIDGNNYLDLAIGAPNAEAVYVYRTYPVAKIIAKIMPESKELRTTDSSLKLKACWYLQSKYGITNEKKFNIQIKLDPQHGRATFDDADQASVKELNVTAGETEKCLDFKVFVKYTISDVFKPIDFDMHYAILDGVPDTEEFCSNCMAVNPSEPKMVRNKVVFSTGCRSIKCVADLKLKSTILAPIPYILGSSRSLAIDYKIENSGETAYLTQINITIPSAISFMRIPSICRLVNEHHYILLCDINNGSPLNQGDVVYFKLHLDTTKLSGNSFTVKAHVISTGDEQNDFDNVAEDVIALGEFSDIEISGKSSKPVISLEDGIRLENITHKFEIRNNGPTSMKNLEVLVSIPVSYLSPWTFKRTTLIDFSSVSINCTYNNKYLDVEWSQNNTILIQDAIESSSQPILIADSNVANGLHFDTSDIGLEFDLNAGSIHDTSFQDDEGRRRRRRALESVMTDGSITYRNYNRYTQTIQEYKDVSRRSVVFQEDAILRNLPVNRTILFDCYDPEEGLCLQARFALNYLQVDNVPIIIYLNFTVDASKVEKIFTDKQDIFVIKTSAQIVKMDDEQGLTIKVVQTHPYTIISKYRVVGTPIWVYIVAAICGILTLILITYGLHRTGFFKRAKKEEMEQYKRQSLALALHQGTDNLDS